MSCEQLHVLKGMSWMPVNLNLQKFTFGMKSSGFGLDCESCCCAVHLYTLCTIQALFYKMSSSEELGTLIQGSPCSPLSCHNCILWQVLPAVRTDHWPDGVNLSLHRWEVHLNQHFPNGGFLPAVLQSEPPISPGVKNQLLYWYMAIHHLPFCDI